MVLSVGSVLSGAFKVCKEVHCRLESLAENNELSDRIQSHIQNLETTATELKNLKQDELPESCTDNITSFNDSLLLCKAACADLRTAAKIKKFISVYGHKRELETLNTQLRRACENLQLMLHQVSLFQNRKLKEAVESGTQDIKRTVVHPEGGVFLPNRVVRPKPQEIKNPQVSLDESGDLIEVNWIDDINPNDVVDNYEIRYDDENEQVVPAQRDKCMLDEGSNAFRIKLGYPKIKPGNLYTIQVRGINGAGPGKWSEPPVIFRFKSGPPNKPRKPAVIVLSPTEVLITISRLSEREENGSCITQCKVEYTEKIDGNDPTWSILQNPIKKRTTREVKFKIGSLKPDATYSFRVRMINDSGESIPSDSCDVITTQLIPGPPQNLRISSKRTSTTIKVRWDEPSTNPQAACKYRIEQRIAKQSEWGPGKTVNKKSAKVTDLETDTTYQFRVRAINNKDELGEWSDEIKSETRFGAVGRTLGTIGAFIGGTVGGPVLGAVSGGAMAGIVAGKHPDSNTGKRAAQIGAGVGGAVAGALFGIIGAPIIGAMSAVMANGKLAGEMEDMSPQTSDDENGPGIMTTLLKNSKQMSSNLLEDL